MQSVIILFGLFLGLFCNARELHFSHLTFKEGFSNNFVSFIANDNKGFFLNVANKRLFFYNNRTFLNKIVCLADNRCNYYIICNVPDKTDSFLRNHRLTLFMIFVVLLIVLLYFTLKINDLLKKKGKLESKLNERTRELDEFKVVIEEKNEEVSHQKEEIIAQAKIIESTNHVLIEQKKLITTQNVELFKHRNKLESLVEERTQELEEAKINAEESDKLKSAFLSNMSHEIRTPMNAILGFSSLLRDKNLSAIEKEEMIQIITSNSKYLLELLNDVLDLSKIQASQMELNHYNVNLHDLMIELYENFTSEAERKNLKLILSIDKISKNFIINTDKIRIKQVLTNLLLNALKYTNIGSIEFGIYDFNNEIVFFVKDTGIGIPSYTGNTIFEHFIKLEDKTKLQSGTGLGLAICKNLVELWGAGYGMNQNLTKAPLFILAILF